MAILPGDFLAEPIGLTGLSKVLEECPGSYAAKWATFPTLRRNHTGNLPLSGEPQKASTYTSQGQPVDD